MSHLRIGIVGCGANSATYHVPTWWDLIIGRWTEWGRPVTDPIPSQVEDIELVAVCDTVQEKASNLAKKYGLRAYFDLDKMLEKEQLDVLDVVTNPGAHCECVQKGLKAGANVYVETPMATSVDEARQMIAAAEGGKNLLGYGENYRFAPHIMRLKNLVDAGDLGDLCSIVSTGDTSNFHHRVELMRWLGGEVTEVYAKLDGRDASRSNGAWRHGAHEIRTRRSRCCNWN